MSAVIALRMQGLRTAALVVCTASLFLAQQFLFAQQAAPESQQQQTPEPIPGQAPQQPAQPTPQPVTPSSPHDEKSLTNLVFKSVVRRVILDVVVTDSSQKPVHGLTREDFSVAEDGKAQRVLSFDVHDFDGTPDTPPPKLPSLPANTFMNVPATSERGPLYVLFYDMVNMEMDDQARARQQLLKFIREKPSGARFAIFVLSDGLRMVQRFTADQNELLAAMDPKSPRPHVPKIFLYADNYGRGQVSVIVAAFTSIARFLDGLPGHKNLIWLTGSLATSLLPTADLNTDAFDYSDEIKEAIDAMARSQVAVYPVDVRGVVPVALSSSPQAGPGGVAMATTSDNPNLNSSYATEGDIATATGGHSFNSTNDIKAALAEATETGANYYTLTYSPNNKANDGRMRKIHVELSKRGYHLEYRRSYYGDYPDSPSASFRSVENDLKQSSDPVEATGSLFANMRQGAPLVHQLLFRVHVHPVGAPEMGTPQQMLNLAEQPAYFRAQHKDGVTKPMRPIRVQVYDVDFTVAVHPPKMAATNQKKHPPSLEFGTVVFDGDGLILNRIVQPAMEEASTPGVAGPQDVYRVQQQIDVPLGATSIRVAVRDAATDRVGAMEVSLPLAPEPPTQSAIPATGSPSPAAEPSKTN
jgi:VWFA-related protein